MKAAESKSAGGPVEYTTQAEIDEATKDVLHRRARRFPVSEKDVAELMRRLFTPTGKPADPVCAHCLLPLFSGCACSAGRRTRASFMRLAGQALRDREAAQGALALGLYKLKQRRKRKFG